jgi:hypothetical protein
MSVGERTVGFVVRGCEVGVRHGSRYRLTMTDPALRDRWKPCVR